MRNDIPRVPVMEGVKTNKNLSGYAGGWRNSGGNEKNGPIPFKGLAALRRKVKGRGRAETYLTSKTFGWTN